MGAGASDISMKYVDSEQKFKGDLSGKPPTYRAKGTFRAKPPLLVVAIVLPYEWMQSNPVLAGFLILATLIVFGVYLRKRRISK